MKYPILKSLRIFLFGFAALIIFAGFSAKAKTIFYFDGLQPDKKSLEFVVYVRVDSDKPLNACDLIVQYPNNLVRFKRVDTNNSIVNIWKRTDVVSENEIVLQGGSAQPFAGENGQIVALIFEAIKSGQDNFIFKKAAAYLADGKGTLADDIEIKSVPIYISQIKLEGETNVGLIVQETPVVVKEDKTPPQILTFKIADNPFNEKEKFLIFETKDNSGSIKHFVRTKKWFTWGPWYETNNPFAFLKNVWVLEFVAVDNFGNGTTKKLYFYNNIASKIIFLILFMFLVGLLIKIGYNKIKRR
jgi:hypothetical protein